MATLTAPEITHIRAMSGDNCEPYDVTDEYMQWLHDNRAASEPLCMSSDSLGGTILWVLRAREAKATNLFDEDGDGGTRNVSQRLANIQKLRERWEDMCGLSGGVITVGTLDTGLDLSAPSTEYASLPDDWGWGLFQ